jgi:4-hydroxybenzoate polyprenyltransferase
MAMHSAASSRFRTFLILGRVSNLPTVWSDCLAGWWLSGGGSFSGLVRVAISASFLYVGGMFLNDAFDVNFDRTQRPTRPIPAGLISERAVWGWGFGWLLIGLAGLVSLGRQTAILSILLAFCILLYNAIHKIVVLAPAVMGSCRFLLYLIAGSIGLTGMNGEVVWKGLALGFYVVGLSCLARKESARVKIQYWPAAFMLAPLCIAGLFDDGADKGAATLWAIVLIFWVAYTFWQTVGREHPNIGQAVSRLLAGIVLVDLLAMASFSHFAIPVLVGCLVLAIALQRYIPAT